MQALGANASVADMLKGAGILMGFLGVKEPTVAERSGVPWESPLMSCQAKPRQAIVSQDFPAMQAATSAEKQRASKGSWTKVKAW